MVNADDRVLHLLAVDADCAGQVSGQAPSVIQAVPLSHTGTCHVAVAGALRTATNRTQHEGGRRCSPGSGQQYMGPGAVPLGMWGRVGPNRVEKGRRGQDRAGQGRQGIDVEVQHGWHPV